ncbi:MAG: SDR family NAD(P)-dependent oxidoreductase [Planctomycetota bacterium]|nr:MAG: SDR family NAD(P)-dependent oxidoreductase [Planctomycetota bacterium]
MSHQAHKLADRCALVTGASAGIGRATALRLASLGARVVVNARRADRLHDLVTEIEAAGGRAVAVAGDCADGAVVEAMLDAAGALADDGRDARATGPAPPLPPGEGRGEGCDLQGQDTPDLVVINAGRGLAGSALTSDPAQWDEMIRTNLTAAAMLLRRSAQRMLAAGGALDRPRDIVVIGSNVGKHVSPFSSMYGSTKFAVGALAEAARRELGPQGIRVSLVCPGIVTTEFQRVAGYTDELQRSFREKFAPLLEADDVARVVAFIAQQPAHVHVNDVVLRPTRQDYP